MSLGVTLDVAQTRSHDNRIGPYASIQVTMVMYEIMPTSLMHSCTYSSRVSNRIIQQRFITDDANKLGSRIRKVKPSPENRRMARE